MSFPFKELQLHKFMSSDKALLHYYVQKPTKKSRGDILMLPGWSQPADVFSPMLLTNDLLKKHYTVYILVYRGWDNDFVDYGNYISRYAMDAQEFICAKKLTNVILVGHSLGVCVAWHMTGLYGEKNYAGYFLMDEPTVITQDPLITNPQVYLELGSIFTSQQVYEFKAGVLGPDSDNVKKAFELSCFTPDFILEHPQIVEKIVQGTNNYNKFTTGYLIYDSTTNNYIEQVLNKGIKKPAFLIGGKSSFVPYQCIEYQLKFYNKCTKAYIYTVEEKGCHLMFFENPTLTNELLNKFLKKL